MTIAIAHCNVLPVASGTTLQNPSSLNFVFGFQVESFLNLFCRLVLRPPFHIENLVSTTHKSFGRAMTLQTPLHLQRRCLVNDRHVVDAAVTRRTTDALLDVNAVIEVREIRQVVYSFPFERLAGAKTRAHGFEVWT